MRVLENRLDEDTRHDASRILTGVLVVALLLGAGGVVYVAQTAERTADPYTEFYVLGAEGQAVDYPTNLSVGETEDLVVGVANEEHSTRTYTVALVHDGSVIDSRVVTVAVGATWEESFDVSFDEAGRHRLELLLFEGDGVGSLDDPSHDLRLWVDATE